MKHLSNGAEAAVGPWDLRGLVDERAPLKILDVAANTERAVFGDGADKDVIFAIQFDGANRDLEFGAFAEIGTDGRGAISAEVIDLAGAIDRELDVRVDAHVRGKHARHRGRRKAVAFERDADFETLDAIRRAEPTDVHVWAVGVAIGRERREHDLGQEGNAFEGEAWADANHGTGVAVLVEGLSEVAQVSGNGQRHAVLDLDLRRGGFGLLEQGEGTVVDAAIELNLFGAGSEIEEYLDTIVRGVAGWVWMMNTTSLFLRERNGAAVEIGAKARFTNRTCRRCAGGMGRKGGYLAIGSADPAVKGRHVFAEQRARNRVIRRNFG